MTMFEVLNNPVNTGGSGTGCSYYSQVLRCPRRAHLNKERQEDAGTAANTGTAFHKLMEWYYGGQAKEALAIEVSDMSTGSPQEQALHMFRHYTKTFKPDTWGRVVGVEVQLPGETGQKGPNIEQMDTLQKAMGIHPWTGRIDMVIDVTASNFEEVKKHVPGITERGIYLWDFKTSGRRNSLTKFMYGNSLQANAYMMAWDALNPKQQCKGMIFQTVVSSNTKAKGITVSCEHYLVPPPNEGTRLGVIQQLQAAQALDATDLCFWTDCYSFFRECPHMGVDCNRTTSLEDEDGETK